MSFELRAKTAQLETHSSKLETYKKMDFFKDLWNFMRERKKFWLLPVIIVLLLLGILLVFGGGSAVAPFIYTLF